MGATMAKRILGAVLGLGGLALLAFNGAALVSDSQAELSNGEAGFVVSSISYGLARDANESGACPNGMSRSFAENYAAATPDAQPRDGESERDFGRRIWTASSTAPTGENLCMHPTAARDPNFRTVVGANISAFGLDLDGQDSAVQWAGPARRLRA